MVKTRVPGLSRPSRGAPCLPPGQPNHLESGMSIFSHFAFHRQQRRSVQGRFGCQAPRLRRRLNVERLEDRSLLSGNVISGYVFNDLNNNGLLDPGESGLANVPLELRNASGVVIATAISDAKGYYQFNVDNTISTAPVTLERS